jgi:hypothetical protein
VQAGTVKTVILAIFNLESVVLMVEFFSLSSRSIDCLSFARVCACLVNEGG